MPSTAYLEIGLFFLILVAGAPLLGAYIAWIFSDDRPLPIPFFRASVYENAMNWKQYATSVLVFGVLSFVVLVSLQLFQGVLPLNPQGLPGVPFWLAVNTAVSFVTNTNWQAYSGESTLSYFVQMVGLGVQNFVSAGTGIAVMVALARSLRREKTSDLGNFWRDLLRGTLYLLLPLSLVLAVVLVSQGVVQSFAPYAQVQTLTGTEQVLPLGPAASQIAIKQLGTNGGGFFGMNSAHPFENPTPLSNFLQMLALLLVPAALPFAFGRLAGNVRHGTALFGSMLFLFLLSFVPALWAECQGNAAMGSLPFLEGKEMRFGIGSSVLWSSATTVASNGSVNAMLSSFSPLAGGLALLNILLGEVVFGGVGSGVYGMVLFAVLTVFIAGLMVGRSPEYFGKKIEAREVRFTVLGVILPSAVILIFCALALTTDNGLSSVLNKGPHGFSEVLYAFASGAGNNGSAFAGLNANTPFYNALLAVAMILGRYGVILPVLCVAGALVEKKRTPPSNGTFSTEGWVFSILLCSVVVIVGALTFFPALSLGPLMEHLLMLQGRVL